LDFSRIQVGALPLRPAPVELGELVRAAATRAGEMLDTDRIVVSLPHSPIHGSWDAARIEQIVSNLVENAIKYSPNGGAGEGTVARDGPSGVVAVRDYGLGIPPEALGRLFERFYRVQDAAHQQINGIGIGLFICREIARRHGGDIAVRQPEGP